MQSLIDTWPDKHSAKIPRCARDHFYRKQYMIVSKDSRAQACTRTLIIVQILNKCMCVRLCGSASVRNYPNTDMC